MSSEVAVRAPRPDPREAGVQRDLAWVADALGAEVVAWDPVSPLRGLRHRRAAFRVALADGRCVKLRRMGREDEARALAQRLEALLAIGLPRVLACDGGSLILEWIPGQPFSAAPRTPARVARAGALLGAIHRTPVAESGAGPRRRSAADELERAEAQLSELVRAERLERSESDAIAARIRREAPACAADGVVHGDFAPENLVFDPEGTLRVVDNESVAVGVLDLDLARAWSRWQLAEASWRGFLTAYSSASGRSLCDADLSGWKLRSLVVSAWYRVVFELPGADDAIARLRAFAAGGPGRGAPADRVPEVDVR